VLGGFSQGGAMGLFSGLTSKVKLAGIVALSSYLLLSLKFAELVPSPDVNRDTPIFMGHGDSDQVVNTQLGKMSHELLKGLGYNATLKIYEWVEIEDFHGYCLLLIEISRQMGHSACLEELDDIEAFLKERLPALGNEGKSEL
jgi:lysophospholipase-1